MSSEASLTPPPDDAALAELDVAVMTRGLERLRVRLEEATHDFVQTQHEVPTYWVGLLATYACQLAAILTLLRDVPEAHASFEGMLAEFLARQEKPHG